MKPLRNAFTMVELLVVVAVIALTVGVFLPAMQRVRAEANRVACQNNLKLLGLALHNYECSYSQFPPACRVKVGITSDLWSVPARLLRYVEQTDLSAQIDFESSYQHQPRITEIRLKMLTCPSEVKARPYTSDGLTYYASSYGINYGTWFIFNPATQAAGDGAFCVNQALKSSDIRDGLSNTLAMAEVKAHQPLIHDGGSPQETSTPPPDTPESCLDYGGPLDREMGHTQWVNGMLGQTGMTTTFAPNTAMMYLGGAREIDVDFMSSRLGISPTRPSYAAVNARSYHPGGVNALLMDGSVRLISNSIVLKAWQDLGSRAGETAPNPDF